MKKLIIIGIAIFSLISFSACGSENNRLSTKKQDNMQTETKNQEWITLDNVDLKNGKHIITLENGEQYTVKGKVTSNVFGSDRELYFYVKKPDGTLGIDGSMTKNMGIPVKSDGTFEFTAQNQHESFILSPDMPSGFFKESDLKHKITIYLKYKDETTSHPSSSESTPEFSISREYKNALAKAKDYLEYSAFSKEGLKAQLIYSKYPEDAAQYAVDNVGADWNEQALKKAKDYLDYDSFSNEGLKDQLVYSKFTEDQAQYAIEHLPK
ncbi:hypothetical protein LMG9449_2139 [Lactococcus lactis subsp. lactis]|uniref:Putative host cell surface-exposed lipoprotein Ltp-like HTH region domain-containing protein n=1 Tax=Lactococcus lactis subsp. lactis TaxID=1360 RepID=A0A0V8DRH2_LACLL|nr:Ltp family lipoprotein [Lactococcus lactis]KSU16253.1 hypothetical protein LMG9449_2139 [Lactococcus lactis subsp. lactis]